MPMCYPRLLFVLILSAASVLSGEGERKRYIASSPPVHFCIFFANAALDCEIIYHASPLTSFLPHSLRYYSYLDIIFSTMNADTAKITDEETDARRRLLLDQVRRLSSEDELEQYLSDIQALIHVPEALIAEANDATPPRQIEKILLHQIIIMMMMITIMIGGRARHIE